MEETKKSKGLIWLIIILIIVILGLIGFIIYDKVLSSDNDKNNSINDNEKIETKKLNLPSDLNNYNLLYWDYQKIYNYYFKMTESDTNKDINIYDNFKNVKVENNKLYWNVDGEWLLDETVKGDIIFFDMMIDIAMIQEYFIVVTNTNNIYYITFNEFSFHDYENSIDVDQYLSLTSDIYNNNINYEIINANGKIEKISRKNFCECECFDRYYFEINNKIKVLNYENKLVDLETYMSEYRNTITSLHNTCSPSSNYPLIINQDGTIENILDKNNKSIKTKYYVFLEKDENNYYHLLIDQNNYLYIIDENLNYQTPIDVVENFEYSRDDYGNEKLNIKLKNNKDICIEKSN